MSLLGAYILISLVFVFATGVEFAFVLLVKQKQEWRNVVESFEASGSKSDKVPSTIVQGYTDHNTGDGTIWSRKCATFHGLPVTTKVDFTGLAIFYFGYSIFNVVYWLRVRDYLE